MGDAVGLLAEHGDEAKVLAGGQSLVPMMSLRLATFGHLVDLNKVAGLDTIERSNGHVRIGALVRQSTAEHDATVAADARLVARALPHIGHFQIRNRGTVGGSIAHADPASELPAVALALDATIEAAGPGGNRDIAAADFFQGTWQTALDDGEILTGVRFPVWDGASGFAVEEVTRRHGDFAICGAVVGVTRRRRPRHPGRDRAVRRRRHPGPRDRRRAGARRGRHRRRPRRDRPGGGGAAHAQPRHPRIGRVPQAGRCGRRPASTRVKAIQEAQS